MEGIGCKCKNTNCPRHGRCQECMAHHKDNGAPACQR